MMRQRGRPEPGLVQSPSYFCVALALLLVSADDTDNQLDSLLQLASVFSRIKMTMRRGNQAVGSDAPLLNAADADLVTSASWPGVRAGESPVVLGLLAVKPQFIHDHTKIRERNHKGLSYRRNFIPADRWRVIVDTERPNI
jgi:hypothetical protein